MIADKRHLNQNKKNSQKWLFFLNEDTIEFIQLSGKRGDTNGK